MYGRESWTIKKAECWRIDVFELWCWRRLLRVPWTARRSNQSILQEISPEYSLEGLMLKETPVLWPPDVKNWFKCILFNGWVILHCVCITAFLFIIVQLSHPCMTTGKTIALTRQTFVGKVMPLLFHMLPRLVITFLPSSKHLLISWLQSPSAVILQPHGLQHARLPCPTPTPGASSNSSPSSWWCHPNI